MQVDGSSGANMQHVGWFDLSQKTNWGKVKNNCWIKRVSQRKLHQKQGKLNEV